MLKLGCLSIEESADRRERRREETRTQCFSGCQARARRGRRREETSHTYEPACVGVRRRCTRTRSELSEHFSRSASRARGVAGPMATEPGDEVELLPRNKQGHLALEEDEDQGANTTPELRGRIQGYGNTSSLNRRPAASVLFQGSATSLRVGTHSPSQDSSLLPLHRRRSALLSDGARLVCVEPAMSAYRYRSVVLRHDRQRNLDGILWLVGRRRLPTWYRTSALPVPDSCCS